MCSMISSQCDELRDKAKLLRMHAKGLEAPYVVPSTKQLMAMAMYDSATRMEGAADTIWELREKFSGVVDERERVRALQAENLRLRDLVRRTMACIRQGEDEYGTDWSCIGCDFCEECHGWEQISTEAVSLGIEVD